MNKISVEITKSQKKIIDIESKNDEDALDKAKSMCVNDEIDFSKISFDYEVHKI